MTESIYERINRTLSWKRVVTFNVGLLILLIVPLSVNLAQQDTENRSGAAGEIEAPVVTPPPNYPSEPPRVDRVTMFFGKKGDTVVLIGNNFGDYQWGSNIFVGNVAADKDSLVRWSNSVIEVKIPETARSGKVWVNVNNQNAEWNGTLLLYDSEQAAKVGLKRNSAQQATLTLSGAPRAKTALVELGYIAEPINITGGNGVVIEQQSAGADALGKKITVMLQLPDGVALNESLLTIDHPGIGAIELIRVELHDQAGTLLPIYADPLEMKVLP